MPDPVIVAFGSRGGSYAALAFFATVFALVGAAAARQIRQRGGTARAAALVAMTLALGPVLLIHASSTGGFYEAEVRGRSLILRYLIWPTVTGVPLDRISQLQARPAFKGRWRLHVGTADGREYESATSARALVESARERVTEVMQTP